MLYPYLYKYAQQPPDAATYDKVKWHYPEGKGVPSLEAATRHFRAIMDWLHANKLLTQEGKEIYSAGIGPDFALTPEMLTPEGRSLLQSAYSDWLATLDYEAPPSMALLEERLAAMRRKGRGRVFMPPFLYKLAMRRFAKDYMLSKLAGYLLGKYGIGPADIFKKLSKLPKETLKTFTQKTGLTPADIATAYRNPMMAQTVVSRLKKQSYPSAQALAKRLASLHRIRA